MNPGTDGCPVPRRSHGRNTGLTLALRPIPEEVAPTPGRTGPARMRDKTKGPMADCPESLPLGDSCETSQLALHDPFALAGDLDDPAVRVPLKLTAVSPRLHDRCSVERLDSCLVLGCSA